MIYFGIPRRFSYLDQKFLERRFAPFSTPRLSTREKFRKRRMERKLKKLLMKNICGQPINDQTRDAAMEDIVRYIEGVEDMRKEDWHGR